MSRFKIRLDTESDVFKFLNVITNLKGKIELVGNDGCTQCRVNARSLIGSVLDNCQLDYQKHQLKDRIYNYLIAVFV